jgi:hypothetical protein
MSVIIQHKRGTADQWTTLNPTLAAGEVGWESDTNKFKIGTGSATWTALPYATLTPTQLSSTYASLTANNVFTGVNSFNNSTGVGTGFAGSTGLEIGYTGGLATTPFIDFHSGATAIDFDSRIIASGGNGTNGQGTLTYTAASNIFTGTVQSFNFVSTIPTVSGAPFTVASTTKVTNLNADLLDGYDTSLSATASTVAVRDTAGAINARHLWTGGYRTTNTAGSFVSQWTRIATLSMLGQYANSIALIEFSSDGPGNTDVSTGRLFVSVKQQNPLGTPPELPTMILSNQVSVTIDDFALVLSQNDGTASRFDLYYRNNLGFQITGFIPIYTSGTMSFYSNEPYVATLPQAFTNTATNPLETEITPIDNMSNYFDGVTNRFRVNYQGTTMNLKNPFRLMISLNGVVQTVNTPEYAWQSPIAYDGFFLDTDGFVNFSESPQPGYTFDGRVMAGAINTARTKNYPFRAVDLLIGA